MYRRGNKKEKDQPKDKDKQKQDSDKNKSEQDGQNKLSSFNNDEISPNTASQGSPNTKKNSNESEYQKEIEVHALYDDENKDHNAAVIRQQTAGDQQLQKGMAHLAIDELNEDDQELQRKISAPTHMKDESQKEEYELNRMKSAPLNIEEGEQFDTSRMQSQDTYTKIPNEPDELSQVKSCPVDANEDEKSYDYERMQSAPPDIFKNILASPTGRNKVTKQGSQKLVRIIKQ